MPEMQEQFLAIGKLVALIPRPRVNLTRYYSAFIFIVRQPCLTIGRPKIINFCRSAPAKHALRTTLASPVLAD